MELIEEKQQKICTLELNIELFFYLNLRSLGAVISYLLLESTLLFMEIQNSLFSKVWQKKQK